MKLKLPAAPPGVARPRLNVASSGPATFNLQPSTWHLQPENSKLAGNIERDLLPCCSLLLAFSMCFLAFCGCKKKEGPPPTPPSVEVVAVAQKDVPIYRDWVGTLEGDVNATISAQVTGYLLTRGYT